MSVVISFKKRVTNVLRAILCALLFLSVPVRAGDKAITKLEVSPYVSTSPVAVTWRVFVPKHEDNRRLTLVIDGDNFYRLTEIQLDGLEAPGVFQSTFGRVPCGVYAVAAAVERLTEKPYVVRSQTLEICAGGQ